MKKIITVFDITDAPWRVLNFACKLAKSHNALLHGIYLSEPTGDTEHKYPFPNDLALTKEEGTDEEINKENQQLVDDNVKLFKEECERAGVECRVDVGSTIKLVEDESLEASVVLADVNAEFVRKLVRHSNAPVCLIGGGDVPERVELPDGFSEAEFYKMFPEFVGL